MVWHEKASRRVCRLHVVGDKERKGQGMEYIQTLIAYSASVYHIKWERSFRPVIVNIAGRDSASEFTGLNIVKKDARRYRQNKKTLYHIYNVCLDGQQYFFLEEAPPVFPHLAVALLFSTPVKSWDGFGDVKAHTTGATTVFTVPVKRGDIYGGLRVWFEDHDAHFAVMRDKKDGFVRVRYFDDTCLHNYAKVRWLYREQERKKTEQDQTD